MGIWGEKNSEGQGVNARQAEAARRNLAEGGFFLFLFVPVILSVVRDREEMMEEVW